jgi:alpha-glucosidase
MRVRQAVVLCGLAATVLGSGVVTRQSSEDTCPGYAASNVVDDGSKLTADLTLAGTACNLYGEDLVDLRLEVEYQTGEYAPDQWTKQSVASCIADM